MKTVDVSHDYHTQSQNITSYKNASSSAVILNPPPPARLTFQTMTNFVSWPSCTRSVSSTPPSSTVMPASSPSIFASSRPETAPESGEHFLSREKQLWRLKNRMETEGVDVMNSGVHIQCKTCTGQLVFI